MKTFFYLIILTGLVYYSAAADFLTEFEKSGFKRTPRYEETVKFCKKLADASDFADYQTYGITPQGRNLPLLIVDKNGNFDPESVRRSGNAAMLIEACIHPGEPDGKDAGLVLLRDMLINKKRIDILDSVTVLFIPIFSPDGHEIWSKYSRINQNGPEETGWRATAQNHNLNRDFLKADSPEMRAWLKLFDSWEPEFFVDCHTTDGADYQYPLTYGLEIWGGMDSTLADWERSEYLPFVEERMEAAGYPIFTYVGFTNWFDPSSGLRSGVSPPMLSQSYVSQRNRPGLLIETHMLKDYKTRVMSTYEMLLNSLEFLSLNKRKLQEMIASADKFAAGEEFRSKPFPIDWQTDYSDTTWVGFKGIDYTVEKSDLTGGDWVRYNGKKRDVTLPWFKRSYPKETAKLPEAYIVPVEWTEVIDRLDFHGIDYYRLQSTVEIPVSSYRFSNTKWAERPYEGRFRLSFDQEEIEETGEFPKGSAVVDMNNPKSRIIAYLLEPKASGSLVNWGFFNSIFEQKEYGEVYVMEKMAREMIKEDPKLLEEFEQWKKNNPDEAHPWGISNWFYQRTPYWDQRIGKYPVGKIFSRELVEELKKK
jgi:murein tripeptide amidase MpaA